MNERQRVEVKSRSEWRAWLNEHHEQGEAIWLVTFKKAAGDAYLPYDAIVEEALAYGWVDSLPRALDDKRSMRLVAPRKAGSAWSAANKARVATLLRTGKMAPAGMAAVERAKADGSWTKIDDAQALRMPRDLSAALKGDARTNFDKFPASTKKAIYEWIGAARTDATRAKRINETVEKAQLNIRANQWRQPKR